MRRILLAMVLFSPGILLADSCRVPVFDEFVRPSMAGKLETPSLQVEMQPVAYQNIPAGFSRIAALPSGSIGFGQHAKGISAILGFETESSISIHKNGVKPGPFLFSIFKGLDSDGCRYLQGYQLESEDYRLHANLGGVAELFAYGKGKRHQFYLIRHDKPDFVLTGLFKNISRAEFESILASLSVDCNFCFEDRYGR